MSRRPVVPGKGFHHIPRLGEEAAWEPPPRCPAVPVGPGRTGGRSVGGGVCCGACGCRRSARRWPAAVRSAVAVQPAVGLRVCCWPRVLGTTGGAGQSAAARAWAEPRSLCGASECHALFLGGGWQWCHVHIQGCLKWLGGPGFPSSHLRSHSAVARGAPRVPPGEVGDPGPGDACGCVELPVGKVTVKARR